MKHLSALNRFVIGTTAVIGGLLLARFALRSVNKYDLRHKVVLITGGSRGLGLIMARKLVSQGAKVVVCSRSEEELVRSAQELAAITQHYLAIPCDITDKEQIRRMMDETKSILGPVDVLINNAGVIQLGPMEFMTEEDYQQAMNIHFWAPFHLMHAVLPDMIKMKNGRIVNIVSIGGRVSFPHILPYNASKFALSGLSEGMAAEMGKNNIKITTVYPGLMRTGSPRNIDVKGRHQQEYAWFKISDSLPLISMSAEKAAEKIIRALKYGENAVILSFPAKIAIALHGIAPDLMISLFDLINRLLPSAKGGSMIKKKGYESSSKLSSSILTKKTEEAEIRNNEI